MPIRGLSETRKQVKQNFLSKIPQGAFKKMRICVDGAWFLRKYANTADICKAFMFGTEEMVVRPILKLIEFMKANEIDLMWVWDGIEFYKPQISNDEQSLEQGFREYTQKNYSKTGRYWRNFVSRKSEIEVANRILEENGVLVVTAPYSATAQCAYFMSIGACSYAFGKSDILLFDGVDRVILDIFDEEGMSMYLDVLHKNRFLEFFGINPKLFSILGLLLGCDFCPTIPNCANDFSFDKVLILVQSSEDLIKFIRASCEDETAKQYIERFFKGLALITYLPVMKISGNVLPYSEDNVPRNLDKLIGVRLAPGFYEALFLNKISFTTLSFIGKEDPKDSDPRIVAMVDRVLSMARRERQRAKEGSSCQSVERSFVNALCPNIVTTGDLDPSTELLLMLSIRLNLLEAPFIPKLLCMSYQASNEVELEVGRHTLRYYIQVSRIFNILKELREIVELLEGRSMGRLLHKQPVLCSSSLRESSNDVCAKNSLKFLLQIKGFLKANRRFNPIVANIIGEIEGVLRNKN